MKLWHDPTISLLGIYLTKTTMLIWKDICTTMFIVTLLQWPRRGSNNVDETWGQYAKWNKQTEKDKCYIISLLCGIYFLKSEQTKETKTNSSIQRTVLVQFSRSVVSNSLGPHEPQHARPPCPSPTPGVHLNACPSSWWCHPTISSSIVPFSTCPQSFPASGSFPWVSSPHQVAKALEFQLQHQSLEWTSRTDLL